MQQRQPEAALKQQQLQGVFREAARATTEIECDKRDREKQSEMERRKGYGT